MTHFIRAKIYIQMVQLKTRCWRSREITVRKNGIRWSRSVQAGRFFIIFLISGKIFWAGFRLPEKKMFSKSVPDAVRLPVPSVKRQSRWLVSSFRGNAVRSTRGDTATVTIWKFWWEIFRMSRKHLQKNMITLPWLGFLNMEKHTFRVRRHMWIS